MLVVTLAASATAAARGPSPAMTSSSATDDEPLAFVNASMRILTPLCGVKAPMYTIRPSRGAELLEKRRVNERMIAPRRRRRLLSQELGKISADTRANWPRFGARSHWQTRHVGVFSWHGVPSGFVMVARSQSSQR